MIGAGLLLVGPQFAAQIFTVDPYQQLVSARGVVLHPVVQIVIDDAGARSERNLAVEVGEEVEPVVMMVLGDGQVGVEHHPMYEVGELAHASAFSLCGTATGNGQSFLEAASFGVTSHQTPERERLSRTDDDAIHAGGGDGEIDGLVLLQLHVHVAQSSANQRIMFFDDDWQPVAALVMGKAFLAEEVLQVPL